MMHLNTFGHASSTVRCGCAICVAGLVTNYVCAKDKQHSGCSPATSLALRLSSLHVNLSSVDRLVTLMVFHQYCCMSLRLFRSRECVSLATVVYKGKSRVTTPAQLRLGTMAYDESYLLDTMGQVDRQQL